MSALHRPELEAPFIAIWHVIGMLIPAIAGAAVGSRFLRWKVSAAWYRRFKRRRLVKIG